MRFIYADPPYPGQAVKHYAKEAAAAGRVAAEVDHAALIAGIVADRPDGWALSTSSAALPAVLSVCPAGVRIAAWVKPFASFKPGVNPAYAWEPVIFSGGRKRGRTEPTVRDWVSCNITLKKGVSGAKPVGFCFWLFDLLGMRQGDVLIDLFPGSGAVAKNWERYQRMADGLFVGV